MLLLSTKKTHLLTSGKVSSFTHICVNLYRPVSIVRLVGQCEVLTDKSSGVCLETKPSTHREARGILGNTNSERSNTEYLFLI